MTVRNLKPNIGTVLDVNLRDVCVEHLWECIWFLSNGFMVACSVKGVSENKLLGIPWLQDCCILASQLSCIPAMPPLMPSWPTWRNSCPDSVEMVLRLDLGIYLYALYVYMYIYMHIYIHIYIYIHIFYIHYIRYAYMYLCMCHDPRTPTLSFSSCPACQIDGHRIRLICIGVKGDWAFIRKAPWSWEQSLCLMVP